MKEFCKILDKGDIKNIKKEFEKLPAQTRTVFQRTVKYILNHDDDFSDIIIKRAKLISKLKVSTKGNFDKKYQKYETPEEDDALYLFYSSLYDENPKSKLAISWCLEHGLFEGDKRKKLEKKL